MARSRASSQDSAGRRRTDDYSVGDLLRPEISGVGVVSANKGHNRPPRTPVSGMAPPLPRPAAAASRPQSCRQPSSAEARDSPSPAPAVDPERPGRIVGAFRVAPKSQGLPQRSHSRGRSPSHGGTPGGASPARASSADARRGRRNIIEENRMAVVQQPRAASAGRAPSQDRKMARDGNNIPLYLQKVKNAISEEERLVAQKLGLDRVDDGAPPGHRTVSDDEKQEILEGLRKRKSHLDSQHAQLPLKIVTYGQKQRAQEIEKALQQVESDIDCFSKPRVFVKL